jgi:predicted metal-dependent peptidase
MARSPKYFARLDKDYQQELNKLKARLNLNNTHGEDSETIRRALVLANKHLDLKERLKDWQQQIFGSLL